MKNKVTQVVLFGDLVQLYHVKSGKYLQVFPHKLAKDERENVKIGLDVNGNQFSYLQVCPRFKIDKDGDRVLTNTEIYLKVSERANEFIHSADRDPLPGSPREINCSLEVTSWKLSIYQSSTDVVNKELLLASQLIYINDPETKSYLSVSDLVGEESSESADQEAGGGLVDKDLLSGVDDDDSNDNRNQVALVPSVNDHLDSNFLWLLEANNYLLGGPVNWKTETVRVKHFNSGLYLRQETRYEEDEEGNRMKSYRFTVVSDRETVGTLLNISEINSNSKYLGNEKALQLGYNNTWIERGDVVSGSAFTFRLCGTKDKDNALSLVFHRFKKSSASSSSQQTKDENDEESIIDPSIRLKEPLDLFVGFSARQYIDKYFQMTDVPPELSLNTIWPTASRTDLDSFKGIIEKLVVFTQGFPVTTVRVDASVDKADPKIRKLRQSLLREQGILQLILDFVQKLIPIFEAVENRSKLNLDGSLLYKMANTVQHLCFSLMFETISDNQENQMFVANSMRILLANLNFQPLAVKCVTEMLSNNMELQETKIGAREIQIFVEKLRLSKLGTMYLRLLQACCSCQGNGVDGNQCKVAELLFNTEGDSTDVVFGIKADFASSENVDWNIVSSIYLNIPPTEGENAIRGYELIARGLPRLTLSWKSVNDFTQDISVSIEELFHNDGIPPSAQIGSPGSLKTITGFSDERSRMAQYLIAEMFLGAEMCLDRNYVAMHKLDNLFPYEVLVSVLKTDVRNDLKAAAVRLLMCLHVDRDPQAASKIPCLTRTWNDIKKNEEPQLPFVDASRRCTFGLIQQLISEHIRQMSGNRWDELSRHMLKMLLSLTRFNFYGTPERMKDIIEPLIAVLDRRAVIFSANSFESVSKSSKWVSEKQGGSYLSENDTHAEEQREREQKLQLDDAASEASSLSTLSMQKGMTNPKLRHAENSARYQKILEFFDSQIGNMIVLGVVCSAVAMNIYQLLTSQLFDSNLTDLGILSCIEIAFLGIFVLEMMVKLLCLCGSDSRNFFLFFNDLCNMMDFIAVGLTIIFFFILPTAFNHGLSLILGLRFYRLINLVTVIGNAKINLVDGGKVMDEEDTEKDIIRYSRAPILELETMVEAINVLAFLQKLIEDRNLSLFLRNFYLWESGTDRRDPAALYQQTVLDSSELSLVQADFEAVMLDCLMFSNSSLVQSVLEVLMAQYSMRSTILENAKNVQLLASNKREKQFRAVDHMLQELEQNAETHELWGELDSDADLAVNKRTKQILAELVNICRIRRFVLEFDEDYMADDEIQDLYRNLGCFEICMKVMGLLDSVEEDEDGDFGEVALNTRNLCLLCNELLYWFFLGNVKNQELGYRELEFFLDTLDDEINSHMVIRAIFKNNEILMKQVPHSHLADLVDKIIKNGKSHHYLTLFASISHVGERNIVENQFEIVKSLTSPGRLQKVACFFCPVDHPDYALKRELMEPYLNSNKDFSLEDLPPLLAYHLMFLEVLSGCTVGRMNITTVEAKVQSVFSYTDILQSILDPGTITACKIRLSKFFYNSIIEVELKIPGLDQSPYIWKLLDTFTHALGYAKDDIRLVEKVGWDDPEVSRQKIEYIVICILITGGFFSRYYDPTTFRFSDGSSSHSVDKVQITQGKANELIQSLFYKIKDIYDLDSPRLSKETKENIFSALEALNKSASKVIINDLCPSETLDSDVNGAREASTAEKKLLDRYSTFVSELLTNANVQNQIDEENVAFITILENLPKGNEPGEGDVRYETLIRKLVQHIRGNIILSEGRKIMDISVTRTSTWIIRAFRTMIENRMAMTIYQRDDDGGLEEDIKAAPVVNALNSCGATALCLDLIADGIDEKLQLEAIKLGVALLYKEGGALEVQQIMNNHLSKPNSDLFFKQVKITLQNLKAWHEWHQIIILAPGEDPNPPESILIIRFLQLMCEGHYLQNQDIMREQPNNRVSYNLLDDFVAYLSTLSRLPCQTSTEVGIRLAATILEVIQGPCEGNQIHFALDTPLIETLNRLNRAKMEHDCLEEKEIELKRVCIDIFQGLLEGQGEKSAVYEKVLSVIHLDIIQMMSKGLGMIGDVVEVPSSLEMSEDKVSLQTECIVLLQMLCNFKPSLYDELGISRNVEDIVGSGTAMIEVIWRGDIHRRFFHVPNVCQFLAKSSKDALVENVDRSNPENKLIDFLARSHDLYREVKHQQYLTEVGAKYGINFARIFSRQNQNRATWITFILAIVINGLFIAFYETNAGGFPAVMDKQALRVINTLNIVQSVVAAFVLLLSVVVRSPVIFQSFQAAGYSFFYSIFYTGCDGKTMYYLLYLVLSVLGLSLKNYYLPFLLLDLVAKNATTRDVLNAVIIPRKQLIMTVVLALFINFIFAYFYVSFYSFHSFF
jgi:hypothetical protein